MDVSKNSGVSPPNHPWTNGGFPLFSPSIWGETPQFLETSIYWILFWLEIQKDWRWNKESVFFSTYSDFSYQWKSWNVNFGDSFTSNRNDDQGGCWVFGGRCCCWILRWNCCKKHGESCQSEDGWMRIEWGKTSRNIWWYTSLWKHQTPLLVYPITSLQGWFGEPGIKGTYSGPWNTLVCVTICWM